MMVKKIIIINGAGGVGKDTICHIVARRYKVAIVSSIDPIKIIARMVGWNGTKDSRDRAFLSDLKRICILYNDYPTNYLIKQSELFLASNNEILFVHIREPLEIEKYKLRMINELKLKCITLLIKRDDIAHWGNSSDDCTAEYNYDFEYHNKHSLEELETDFIAYFEKKILTYSC